MAKFTIHYARHFEFDVEASNIEAATFGREYEKQYGDNVKVLSILAEGRTVADTDVRAAKVEAVPMLTLNSQVDLGPRGAA